jgi:hypothetical protein
LIQESLRVEIADQATTEQGDFHHGMTPSVIGLADDRFGSQRTGRFEFLDRRGKLVNPLIEWIVANLKNTSVGFACHARYFLSVQGACTDASEDCDLVPRFIHGSISIDPARNAQGMSLLGEFARRDQTRVRSWRETIVAVQLRTGQLDDSQSIFAVGDIRELADVGDP